MDEMLLTGVPLRHCRTECPVVMKEWTNLPNSPEFTMIAKTNLPHILAVINLLTIMALSFGLFFIHRGDRNHHRTAMIVAALCGVAFLVLYLIYHFGTGLAKFGGYGFIRPVYFTLLIVHILMAAVSTPLVPLTVYRGLSGKFVQHQRLARWAWGIWFVVALSGLVVYVMTIHFYPYRP
jgi:putative membrane protein